MALRLNQTRILEDGVQGFTFIIEEFSSVGECVFSKPFHFSGHRWRLQSGIKGGKLGVFLRWIGGGNQTLKTKCRIKLTVDVLNNKDPSNSVQVGSLEDEDDLPRTTFGIGWSKIMDVEEIEKPNSGFLDDNSLYIEIKFKMVHTVFEDKMVVNLTAGTDLTASSKFSIFGTEWSILMYPRGDRRQENTKNSKHDHASVYLKQEKPNTLRFKVTYTLYIPEGKEVTLMHHFYEAESSSVFGVEKFIRTRDLKALAKGGTVPVGVRITSIEPYFYLGFDTKEWSPPQNLGSSIELSDYTKSPLSFKAESLDQKKLDFKLQFDPGPECQHSELDESAYYVKILWSIMVFCYMDDEKSTSLHSWDSPGHSAFCYSKDEMTITSPLLLSEAVNPYSPFLDEEKLLSVKLIIHNNNELYDPLLIDGDKHSIAKLREMTAQTKSTTEKYWADKLNVVTLEKDQIISEKDEEIDTKGQELDDKEVAIHTLEKEIEENEEYINDIEDGRPADEELKEQKHKSLKDMVNETEPDAEDIKKQNEVADKLKNYLTDNLPFSVSRISLVGAAGQGTCVKHAKEAQLAVFIKDLPRTEHKSWLPAILYTTKTLLKQQAAAADGEEEPLPPCSDFTETECAVQFKCDDVNMTLIPTNDWEPNDGFHGLYQMCLKQPQEAQQYYHVAACERQTEFIANQPEKCKELIRAVKAWCNTVQWRNSSSNPGEYLLSLLVIAAYQIIQSSYISHTTSADKEVFVEFAEMVNDTKLEIFWNEYYLASNYPRELFPVHFEYPIVQDPAVPTHNVAETELKDWGQLRKEVCKWVEMMST